MILGVGIGVLAQPQLVVRFMTVHDSRDLNRGVLVGGIFILVMTGVSYLIGELSNVYIFHKTGQISFLASAGPDGHPNIDRIMPMFLSMFMPRWYVYIFMLALLSAAMSTLSALLHVAGTSLGHDFHESALPKSTGARTILVTRAGIVAALVLAVWLATIMPPGIVAMGCGYFFGLFASMFLPMLIGCLFTRRLTKQGALAGMLVGMVVSLFWVVLVHDKEATSLGVCQALFGRATLLGPPWVFMDSLTLALPLSALVTFVVPLLTRAPDVEHLARCFGPRECKHEARGPVAKVTSATE